jgi:hypothetical protein
MMRAITLSIAQSLMLALCVGATNPCWAEDAALRSEASLTLALETTFKKRPLSQDQRGTLASIYLLKNECTKLKSLYKDKRQPIVPLRPDDSDRLCACDGPCDVLRIDQQSSLQQALYALRSILGAGRGLNDADVEKLLALVGQQPEAKFLVFKRFRKSTLAKERALAERSWRELSRLEVRPK